MNTDTEKFDLFWSKVDTHPPSGCWIWTGWKDKQGYGRFLNRFTRKRSRLAHRTAYEIWNGDIPDGMQIDHLCCNPSCVNPDHLEAVTPGENSRRVKIRGRARCPKRDQSFCKRGHPLLGENLHVWFDGQGRRHRQCKECNRLRGAKKCATSH